MTAQLLAGIIFGSIGFAAFVYGKKAMRYKVMTIGALLMGFPYVVSSTVFLYIIGCALTGLLWVFRE